MLPSLRLWLQSTSLLAVLAGYALLLVLNQALTQSQRLKAHRELVAQIAGSLKVSSGAKRDLAAQSPISVQPGIEVLLLPELQSTQPQLQSQAGQNWLVSTTPVQAEPLGLRSLVVRQNVTASVEGEHATQVLLIAAAGLSTLLTGALLRLVLRRGLVQPLKTLSSQINALQPPPAPSPLLLEALQPQELKPIAESFNAMQARLGESWERQRAFVDGLAHELRTPLTLISGHAQSLLRHSSTNQPPELESGLRLIEAEAHRMALLVSDLLDLARRDAGRLQLQCGPLGPEEALVQVLERLTPTAQGRLQLLSTESSARLPPVIADPERLQQCLVALIDNALRYSPAPRPVQLFAEVSDQSLVLHVRDQGPGVPADERVRIFDRFVRGSAATDSRGSGLGLSIVKLLIEAMDGRVGVTDAPGGGADFQLTLRPVAPLA